MAQKESVKQQEERFKQEEALEQSQKVEAYSLSFDDLQKRSLTVREETGQAELVEKETLIGKPFIIPPFGWTQRQSDMNAAGYVSVEGILKDFDKNGRNKRIVFNDGGAGILDLLTQLPKDQPIFVEKGLRKSTFLYAPELHRALAKGETYDGPTIKSETFYLT